jgi:branched-chain amino acid transport system substrate-binding protein
MKNIARLRARTALGLVGCLTATAGCGTRVDNGAGVAVATGAATDAPIREASTGRTAEADSGDSPLSSDAGAAGATQRRGDRASVGATQRSGQAAAPSTVGASEPGVAPSGTKPAPGLTPTTQQRGQPATPAPGSPAPVPTGRGPIRLASIGTWSGAVGATLSPILQGGQLWVKMINSRGGLNGQPIQLLVFDDAGDPARHRAQVQEAVERQGIVAMLNNAEPITGQGSVEYITQKRIPIIGNTGAETWSYSTPMIFPQQSAADFIIEAIIASGADVLVPQGKTKLGTVMCAEVSACRDGEHVFSEHAKSLGFEYVYKGQASLAQPDFTAECLAARNAGVQSLLIFLDTQSLTRFAASCAVRVSRRPTSGRAARSPTGSRWTRI